MNNRSNKNQFTDNLDKVYIDQPIYVYCTHCTDGYVIFQIEISIEPIAGIIAPNNDAHSINNIVRLAVLEQIDNILLR